MGYGVREEYPEVSIIIASYNALPDTRRCIETLRRHLAGEAYEIIVIDNGSQEDAYRWISMQPDLHVIRNEENRGLAAAWNQGIAVARAATILFLHNDVVLGKNAFRRMREALWSREDIGVTGPYANCDIGEYHPERPYPSLEDIEYTAEQMERSHADSVPRLFLHGFCLMAKRSVVTAVGGFDERYPLVGYEDVDFSLRVVCKGYFLLLVNAYVHHETSIASKEAPKANNLGIFHQIWQICPEYSLHIREEVIEYIDKKKPGLCVLDIGCACGGALMWLKYHNPQAELHGIELESSAARIAGQFGHVEAQDVESFEREEWKGKFDYIIMGDVLEHLRDPWKTLHVMAGFLKPKGKVIACVPNVGHISNVWGLLNGEWHYRNQGILDRTHLRFFTRQSFEEGLRGTGMHRCDFKRTVVGLSKDVEQVLDRLARGLCALEDVAVSKEELYAYQWIFLLEKDS